MDGSTSCRVVTRNQAARAWARSQGVSLEVAHRKLQKEHDNYTDALNLTRDRFIYMKRKPWQICTDTRSASIPSVRAKSSETFDIGLPTLIGVGAGVVVVAYLLLRGK